MREVRPLSLDGATDAVASALGRWAPPGYFMTRVSIVLACRIDGVDDEIEYRWEKAEPRG